MWKFIYDSVEGTSHRCGETPCQDSAFVSCLAADGETVLIAACADGAGSATLSQRGSKLACESAAAHLQVMFEAGARVETVDEAAITGLFDAARDAIARDADAAGVTPRDLACTLLVAVVACDAALFAQIGDGAIVIRGHGGDEYRTAFWPQSGEYQNTTFFVTDPSYRDHLQWLVVPGRIDRLALFTDGLQMLALNYASRAVHGPFFAPLFDALDGAADVGDLQVPMRQFFDSPPVNERTDDDKTLILATRVSEHADVPA